jgi:hypothetical protein
LLRLNSKLPQLTRGLRALCLKEVQPEKPEERSPDAIRRRSAGIGDNPSLSRQALHSAIDNSAKFGGVFRLTSHCQSATCVADAEPSGIALLFLGRVGVTDLQEEGLHDEFLDAIA